MAADVHAIALVADGAADSADRVRRLDNDRPDSCPALEFKRRSQAGWTGADDYSRLPVHCQPPERPSEELLSP